MSNTIKYSLGLEEFNSKEHRLWKSTIAEFIGNFILNFFSCGAFSQPEDGTFKSLSLGLGVFVAITIVGPISGGYINPAVTIAMLLTGRISFLRTIFYIVAQCLGAAIATSVVSAVLDEAYHNGLGHTTLAEDVTEVQGFVIELFLGLLVVLTVFGALDGNKQDYRLMTAFAIAMSVTLGHLGTIRYTGSSMNPARTFGTAYATNNWDYHWIYWAGPILGGIVAALVYTQILEKPSTNLKDTDASDKYRIHAYERDSRKLDNPSSFV